MTIRLEDGRAQSSILSKNSAAVSASVKRTAADTSRSISNSKRRRLDSSAPSFSHLVDRHCFINLKPDVLSLINLPKAGVDWSRIAFHCQPICDVIRKAQKVKSSSIGLRSRLKRKAKPLFFHQPASNSSSDDYDDHDEDESSSSSTDDDDWRLSDDAHEARARSCSSSSISSDSDGSSVDVASRAAAPIRRRICSSSCEEGQSPLRPSTDNELVRLAGCEYRVAEHSVALIQGQQLVEQLSRDDEFRKALTIGIGAQGLLTFEQGFSMSIERDWLMSDALPNNVSVHCGSTR